MTMKANELRIGNFFRWISTGEIDTVKDICTYDKKECNINSVSISDCEPITLTEEWLLKFGFEERYGYIKNGVHLNTDYSLFIEDEIGFNEWVADCECVHQLQNLYFVLTGEELKLNEP